MLSDARKGLCSHVYIVRFTTDSVTITDGKRSAIECVLCICQYLCDYCTLKRQEASAPVGGHLLIVEMFTAGYATPPMTLVYSCNQHARVLTMSATSSVCSPD